MTLSNSPAARARAGVRWATLGNRLRTISPEALTKGGIAALVVGGATMLSVATWPSLLPFVVGVVIAYSVLPIANRLDRFMPRVIAALLAELVAVATESATNLQASINGFVDSAASIVSSQILGVFNTLSFVLGLLVIPAWVLTIVADERHIKRRAASLLPVAMRRDAGAIVAIMDRAFGTFLRHRVLLAIVSGLLVWGGLEVTNSIGLTQVRYTATAGTLLGFLQLIPELGFFLGIFPILLFIPLSGPVAAATAFVVYWAAVKLADGLVGGRVSKGVLDVHPAVLLPAIVVLSQFGIGWLVAAAPVIAIIRDLVRYGFGRLSDPPTPAGVMPGVRGTVVLARPVQAPSVYRGMAARPARGGGAPAPLPTLSASTVARPSASSVADSSWRPAQ